MGTTTSFRLMFQPSQQCWIWDKFCAEKCQPQQWSNGTHLYIGIRSGPRNSDFRPRPPKKNKAPLSNIAGVIAITCFFSNRAGYLQDASSFEGVSFMIWHFPNFFPFWLGISWLWCHEHFREKNPKNVSETLSGVQNPADFLRGVPAGHPHLCVSSSFHTQVPLPVHSMRFCCIVDSRNRNVSTQISLPVLEKVGPTVPTTHETLYIYCATWKSVNFTSGLCCSKQAYVKASDNKTLKLWFRSNACDSFSCDIAESPWCEA